MSAFRMFTVRPRFSLGINFLFIYGSSGRS